MCRSCEQLTACGLLVWVGIWFALGRRLCAGATEAQSLAGGVGLHYSIGANEQHHRESLRLCQHDSVGVSVCMLPYWKGHRSGFVT